MFNEQVWHSAIVDEVDTFTTVYPNSISDLLSTNKRNKVESKTKTERKNKGIGNFIPDMFLSK